MRPTTPLLGLALAVSTLAGPPAAHADTVAADEHTLETPELAPGQIELLTVSTFPDAVTGGDVLVEVRGLVAGDTLTISLDGVPGPAQPIEAAAAMTPVSIRDLVEGMSIGEHTIEATANGSSGVRVASLRVVNHPISGPVISGPHQTPFRCRTADVGLGEPSDGERCFAETRFDWFYFSQDDQAWHPLDTSAPAPSDVAITETSDGRAVAFIVRVETAVINRGIARMAVLDDPYTDVIVNGSTLNWNGRVYHSFGESCGVGYDQGRNGFAHVLGGVPNPGDVGADNLFANLVGLMTRLGEGDVVVHSTLTAFGNHCNPFVSAETAMMIKEHLTERYFGMPSAARPIQSYVGTGSSGGALQQYNLANNNPGLLDAAMPGASFADIATTAMTVTDCGLFTTYFGATELDWSPLQQAAVTGHNPQTGTAINSICQSWTDAFLDRIDADSGCGGLRSEDRYHAEHNPTGARCTVQDANVNWLGIDDATGFANRPLDNVGVQYGLRAFNAGLIDFEQFADLNERIGGWDIDGDHQPARHAMSDKTADLIYDVGQVIGRGALEETPIIDFAPYLDLIPVANIHESARPFILRHRARQAGGDGSSLAIWRGVVVQSDGFDQIDAWIDGIEQAPKGLPQAARVQATKPLTAIDQCALGTVGGRVEATEGVRLPLGMPVTPLAGAPGPDANLHLRAFVPEDHESGIGPCSAALPPVTTTRIAAGGPAADDVIKCQRKPIDPADYTAALTGEQQARLAAIFPDGVCDWSKPSVGDDGESLRWPSLGGAVPYLDAEGDPAAVSLSWRVARS